MNDPVFISFSHVGHYWLIKFDRLLLWFDLFVYVEIWDNDSRKLRAAFLRSAESFLIFAWYDFQPKFQILNSQIKLIFVVADHGIGHNEDY